MINKKLLCMCFRPFIRLRAGSIVLNRVGLADMLFHVGFVTLFVALFFFYYISLLEATIVRSEISRVFSSLSTTLSALPAYEPALASLDEVDRSQTNEMDVAACSRDRSLKNGSLACFTCVCVGAIVLSLILVVALRDSTATVAWDTWGSLVYSNLVVVTCVGFSEYLLQTFFVKNLVILDSNFVRLSLIESITSKSTRALKGSKETSCPN